MDCPRCPAPPSPYKSREGAGRGDRGRRPDLLGLAAAAARDDCSRRPAPPPPHGREREQASAEGGRRPDLLELTAAVVTARDDHQTTPSCGLVGGAAAEGDGAGKLGSDGGANTLNTDNGGRRASGSFNVREVEPRKERERADEWARVCKGKEVLPCAAVCWRQRNKI
jgi:hypothetical protein